MHTTLTEHARCVWGDEYGPTPECEAREHHWTRFAEELTFADSEAILAMLRELCPNLIDGLLPVWVRNLAYRLILLQRPHDPAMMREAALNLEAHGPSWDDIAEDLRARADALDPAGARPWGHG
ncbi:hypothetical protein OG429_03820 [Streptomyces sp. NBC_00190]|uniref:hypothetical protein n=1 Tax=unclassified Streptomyces TaxID=2593676 RepID=UPI002E2A98D6|nr:hypothetical protein [Streptomyces sp. NBC_00190]WSZ38525.1 hypothetical protein OG239_06825 [Streptomyces sp. NBC_00868]